MARPSELIPGFPLEEQVFETHTDPRELANRALDPGSLPAQVWLLRQTLGNVTPPGRASTRQLTLPDPQVEQLRALGYIDRETGAQ
jgi:hypothetical protein